MAGEISLLLGEVADLRRRVVGTQYHGVVEEVRGDKLRVRWGTGPRGQAVLSPWLDTSNHRGGARERRFYDVGQNVTIATVDGEMNEAATVSADAPNNKYKAPDQADDAGAQAETYQLDQLHTTKKTDCYLIYYDKGGRYEFCTKRAYFRVDETRLESTTNLEGTLLVDGNTKVNGTFRVNGPTGLNGRVGISPPLALAYGGTGVNNPGAAPWMMKKGWSGNIGGGPLPDWSGGQVSGGDSEGNGWEGVPDSESGVSLGDMTETLTNYPTLDFLADTLTNYPTFPALAEILTGHPTFPQLTQILTGYVTNNLFDTTLTNYATTASLNATVANYLTVANPSYTGRLTGTVAAFPAIELRYGTFTWHLGIGTAGSGYFGIVDPADGRGLWVGGANVGHEIALDGPLALWSPGHSFKQYIDPTGWLGLVNPANNRGLWVGPAASNEYVWIDDGLGCGGTAWVGGSLTAVVDLIANHSVQANQYYYLRASGVTNPQWLFQGDPANGSFTMWTPFGAWWQWRAGDWLVYNNLGPIAAHGITDWSDERGKRDIVLETHGLDIVNQLQPIEFERQTAAGRREVGFSGQEIKRLIPEATITVDTESEQGRIGVSPTALVAVAVNAIKELARRVERLEEHK